MDYSVRQYQPGDEEDIVPLLELVFNGWPHFDLTLSPLDHWKWKFVDNPFKKSWIALAENDGRIVGCNHAIPIKIKVGEKEYFSSYGYDLAVHPDYRGLGLASKMHELRNLIRVRDGVEYTPFESGNPIYRKSLERRYPRFPHKVSIYARICDPELHFEKNPTSNVWLKKIGVKIIRKMNELKKNNYIETSETLKVMRVSHFNNEIDNLWEELKDQFNYAVVKNYKYLNWRYCDPRGGNYVIYLAQEADNILGYIVLRINRYDKDYPVGYVVDLLAPIDRLVVAELLIEEAVRYLDKENINYTCVQIIDSHKFIKVFQKHGFINSRNTMSLFYKFYSTNQDEFKKVIESPSSMILINYGDKDAI